MGLDNGFVLHGADAKTIPSFVDYDIEDADEIQVIYWRKCWGLRANVLRVLHCGGDGGEFKVEAEDIPAIVRGMYKFFDSKVWEEDGDSIWTFEEFMPNLINSVMTLTWLETYLRDHPEVECLFYDSY